MPTVDLSRCSTWEKIKWGSTKKKGDHFVYMSLAFSVSAHGRVQWGDELEQLVKKKAWGDVTPRDNVDYSKLSSSELDKLFAQGLTLCAKFETPKDLARFEGLKEYGSNTASGSKHSLLLHLVKMWIFPTKVEPSEENVSRLLLLKHLHRLFPGLHTLIEPKLTDYAHKDYRFPSPQVGDDKFLLEHDIYPVPGMDGVYAVTITGFATYKANRALDGHVRVNYHNRQHRALYKNRQEEDSSEDKVNKRAKLDEITNLASPP